MKHVLGLTLISVAVAGCVSVLPEPVVPKGLYRLSSSHYSDGASEIAPLAQSITIFQPGGSDLLLGKAIVFEDADGSLSLIAEAKWSDTLSRQLQATLIEVLSGTSDGSGQSGYALSDRFGATTPFELQWEVRDMVIQDNEAVVVLSGLVSEFKTGTFKPVAATVRKPYSGSAESAGVSALIDASREALNELGNQVSAAVSATAEG